MMHHAYFYEGTRQSGVAAARTYAEATLGLTGQNNPDIVQLSYGILSVEDARKLVSTSYQSGTGGTRLILVAASRIFHEAQNALLKALEEPPHGTTLVLIVPSAGILLPTVRSRLHPLPKVVNAGETEFAEAFMHADTSEREKIVARVLARAKSDKDSEKQGARDEALGLISGLTVILHKEGIQKRSKELHEALVDLHAFLPILFDRSAPLKLILEHLLLVIPGGVQKAKV